MSVQTKLDLVYLSCFISCLMIVMGVQLEMQEISKIDGLDQIGKFVTTNSI